MLFCAGAFAERDSRPHGGLPEVEVTGVNRSESATAAADPAHGPAPAPVTRAGLSSVTMPGEAPIPLFAASSPAPVFAFGPAGAGVHAGPPASDEARDAGMLTAEHVFACPVLDAQPRVFWLAGVSLFSPGFK